MKIIQILKFFFLVNISICASHGKITGHDLLKWAEEEKKMSEFGSFIDFSSKEPRLVCNPLHVGNYFGFVVAIYNFADKHFFVGPNFCPPKQIGAIVYNYLKDNPKEWSDNAHEICLKAYMQAFPKK